MSRDRRSFAMPASSAAAIATEGIKKRLDQRPQLKGRLTV
jgi:hypothetical protein